MTEPIIINGVDVSECIHYKNQTCIANYLFTNIPFSEAKCKISPNCHYKQLKRKEQKCEKYKNCLYEIKNFQKRNCETCNFYKTENCNNSCQVFVILEEINEVESESK